MGRTTSTIDPGATLRGSARGGGGRSAAAAAVKDAEVPQEQESDELPLLVGARSRSRRGSSAAATGSVRPVTASRGGSITTRVRPRGSVSPEVITRDVGAARRRRSHDRQQDARGPRAWRWLVAALCAVAQWVASCWRRLAEEQRRWTGGGVDGDGRAAVARMLDTLRAVEKAQPAPPDLRHIDGSAAGAVAAAQADEDALDRLRTHRAPRTTDAVRTTTRSIREFVMANPDRAARAAAAGHSAWDRLLEAWIAARVAPHQSPWSRPQAWRQTLYDASATAKAAGSWRAAMVRLRHAPDEWPRSRAMAAALGAKDNPDGAAGHADPIFAWEVLAGLRDRPPTNVWERCAAALLVVGTLGAARTGNTRRLTIGRVRLVADDTVSVTHAERPKPARDRPVARADKHLQPVRLRHWAVRRIVIPWIRYLREAGLHETAYVFPSLVRPTGGVVRTANGRDLDGLWCEPLREWSDRATAAALGRFISDLHGRSFRCLRAGNNIELRRSPAVRDVTRRQLHGRTVRDLIGSESAYNETFAEDYAAATAVLGSTKFVRQPDGLLSAVEVSKSAGERDDWQRLPGAVPFAASDGDGSTSSDDGDDGADDARCAFECFRCSTKVRRADHGWLCDHPGCERGTCVACNPGGARATLFCPDHQR